MSGNPNLSRSEVEAGKVSADSAAQEALQSMLNKLSSYINHLQID
jgi:hypothetical protein